MTLDEENPVSQYVYAFIEGEPPTNLPAQGVDDQAIELVQLGSLTAVCSAFSQQQISPRRRYLVAHASVMQALFDTAAVLPMSFGLLAPSRSSLHTLIETNRSVLQQALSRVRHKVEMSVKLRPVAGTDIFTFILNRYPEIAMCRDEVFSTPESDQYTLKIELGKRFERALNNERRLLSQQLHAEFSGLCGDLQIDVPAHTRHLLEAACLVRRDDQPAFNDGIGQMVRRFNDDLCFDLAGPWVPYHFSSISLQMDKAHVYS